METMKKRMLTGSKAMAEAITLEMERDPAVFVMGEDVGKYGGIFGSTQGLFEKFGSERVMDTDFRNRIYRCCNRCCSGRNAPDRRIDVC